MDDDSSNPPAGLTPFGWDETWATTWADQVTDPSLAPGRVGRVDRGRCEVHLGGATVLALPRVGAGADVVDQPATGDWVAVEQAPTGAVVRQVLPRRTSVVRIVSGGRSDAQVMAANVDIVLVAVPCEEVINLSRVERYLTVAWESGAQPLVVLTKADLGYDPDTRAEEVSAAAPGVEVLVVSAETGEGLDVLRAVLGAGTTALVGQSGAGKSTLVNVLLGEEVQLVQETRQDGKGRHTTTARDLRVVPGGGVLVDTPGLRSIGLHEVGEGVGRTFPDIEELVARCRFADCGHESEPGCAVRSALADGSLSERRLASWRRLLREAEHVAARTDPALRAQVRKRWTQAGRAGRAQAALKRGEH